MYQVISRFLNINRPSLALIILAWLAFNFNTIFLIYPIKINELLLFFLPLFILEIIFTFISNKKISLFVFLNTFLFLFGYLLTLNIQNLFNNLFDIFLRGRIIFLSLFLILNISLILVKKIPNYKYVNIFIIIFITANLSKNLLINLLAPEIGYVFENKKVIFPAKDKNKPILLLILDEYHSPDDLFRVTKDSSIYNFSSTLKRNGWQTNTSFYSKEIATVRSLSSMFNYNLSYDTIFRSLGENGENINDELFSKNLLFSDLFDKNIEVKNWGVFNFGSTKPPISNKTPKRIKSIPMRFIQSTALNLIWSNTNKFSPNGFQQSYFLNTKHNIHIIKKLNDSINENKPNYFIYSHLLMPHSPFYYPNYFNFKKSNLKNYVSFFVFTNSFIENKLLELSSSSSMKIIVTGDHGFRHDLRLNKNKTFLALYGFDTLNINEIKTVQDLGSLINSNF